MIGKALRALGHSVFVEQRYLAERDRRNAIFGFGFGFMFGALVDDHARWLFFGIGFLVMIIALIAAFYNAPE
jgi:hypothetical protein